MIAHYESAERVCWNSAKKKTVKCYPGGIKEHSVTHHIRVGTKVPPTARRVEAKLIPKATNENVPILEVIVNVWCKKGVCSQLNGLQVWGITKPAQSTVLHRPEESVRTRSIVRFAMRVPSYSAANRDDEYNVKTNNSSWPKTTMSLVSALLGLGAC